MDPVDKKWCGVRELDAGKGTAAGRPFANKKLFSRNNGTRLWVSTNRSILFLKMMEKME
jgi:hypothetical protein